MPMTQADIACKFPKYTIRPGGAEYRTVSTETEKGVKEAEKLHQEGWAVAQTTLFGIQFWRPKNKEER